MLMKTEDSSVQSDSSSSFLDVNLVSLIELGKRQEEQTKGLWSIPSTTKASRSSSSSSSKNSTSTSFSHTAKEIAYEEKATLTYKDSAYYEYEYDLVARDVLKLRKESVALENDIKCCQRFMNGLSKDINPNFIQYLYLSCKVDAMREKNGLR